MLDAVPSANITARECGAEEGLTAGPGPGARGHWEQAGEGEADGSGSHVPGASASDWQSGMGGQLWDRFLGTCRVKGPLLLSGGLSSGEHVADVRKTNALFLALPLSSSVVLGNFLQLSEPQFTLL